MRDRRLGRFTISFHTVDECPEIARALLRDMIVLRVEAETFNLQYAYVGAHPSFVVVPLGTQAPDYSAEITTGGDGRVTAVKWVKL